MRNLLQIAFAYVIVITFTGAWGLYGWRGTLLVFAGVMGGWWLRELRTWKNDEGTEDGSK